jgi:DNA-directed RNA polymerase specialized sigma24 family protein
MDDIVAAPQTGKGIVRLLDRALVTAWLLTGSLHHAEAAVLEAIETWNPGEEPEDVLFQNVLEAAARAQVESDANHPDSSDSCLPDELKAILRLAPGLRSCFVLRKLAGLPTERCGRLLGLHSALADRYTRDALRRLPADSIQ